MTRRQCSNQWSGGLPAQPVPNYFECKFLSKIFRFYFFVIKSVSSSLIIFHRANLTVVSITYLCWCNWMSFWRKKCSGNFLNVVLFLHENTPAHRALATQMNLSYLGFQYLELPNYSPHMSTSDNHLLPGLEKNWNIAIFLPTWWSLLPRRPGWTDNILNFLSGLQGIEQWDVRLLSFVGSMVHKSRVCSL